MLIKQETLILLNNNKTRFTLDNYFNVTNVYNTPDVGFVSGAVEAFKTVNLYDTVQMLEVLNKIL